MRGSGRAGSQLSVIGIRKIRKPMSDSFIQKLNKANVGRDDPFQNQFNLVINNVESSKPLINTEAVEFPSDKQRRRYYPFETLESVVADESDIHPKALDLDISKDNLAFLQKTIRSMVSRDAELSGRGHRTGLRMMPDFSKV